MTSRTLAILAAVLVVGNWIARPQTIPEWLAMLVVVFAAPLIWLVAFDAWSILREAPELGLLRAAVVAFFVLAILTSVFALVFLNNGVKPAPLDLFETQILTRVAFLVGATTVWLIWRRTRARLRRLP